MNVNISTAKAILRVYQSEGRVGKKQKRDKVVSVIQSFSVFIVDGLDITKIDPTIIKE